MNKYAWIMKGLLMGFVFFLAAYLIKPIGVSTQFSVLSGKIHALVVEGIISQVSEDTYTSTNAYYAKNNGKLINSMNNLLNYDYVFVLSIPLGAYVAAKLTGEKKDELEQNTEISAVKVPAWKQFTGGFVGGLLLLYGARMADGCTSGHMMAGMSQGSFSGFVFTTTVFLVAIPVAILMKKSMLGGK